MGLSVEYMRFQEYVSEFINSKVIPLVKKSEDQGYIERQLFCDMAREGFLGANIPKVYGGADFDMMKIGILNEEFAKASSSIRSIFTVQGMVALAILRWGNEEQRRKWLPKLASGELIGAFALAEEQAGSDAGNIQAYITKQNNRYILNGHKIWTTMGQIADIYLVFAKYKDNIMAVLVEKNDTIEIEPVTGLLGVKASMIANITYKNCIIPMENLIGTEEAGLKYVIPSCLDYGRYTVAWASLGICRVCVELCREYVSNRKQFGHYLKEYQLIQEMITKMVVMTKAVQLYCYEVAGMRERAEPESIIETMSLKYLATKIANMITNQSVQIFGANGCCDKYPIERYFRDARINEIIEGSSQMHEIIIAGNYV